MKNVQCPKCKHDLAIQYEDGRIVDAEGCGYDSRTHQENDETTDREG